VTLVCDSDHAYISHTVTLARDAGHAYLNAVITKSRIFTDLCQASHYLLPSEAMPPLPPAVLGRLRRSMPRQVAQKSLDISKRALLAEKEPC